MESELDLKLLPDSEVHGSVVKSQKFLSLRFFVALISLWGCAVMYMTRINLNVAIIDMVFTDQIEHKFQNNLTLHSDYCPINKIDLNNETNSGEFNWSPPIQGIVLGSFYYGYVWPQIFGGRLSELYGAKHMIGYSILISGLINLLTPYIIRWNFYLFITSRVVLGLVQGILFPSFMALMAKWIPHEEHSTFIPWLDVGCTVGTIIVSVGAGHLIENNVMGGWPSVFYISGISAIIWCLIWFSFITSLPSTHNWISETELNHILRQSETSKHKNIRESIPWKRILTSKPFLSILITKLLFGITWDFITAKIPAYLQDVLHFPISEIGNIYSVLMICLAITTLSCGFIADIFINSERISKTNVRKIFQTISGLGMALPLILIPLIGCNKALVITLLTFCMLLMGVTSGGDVPIVADMTEEYAGTVFAIMNSIGSINGFIVPYFVGVVIDKNPDSMQIWSQIFYFSAIVDIIGVIIFVLFSSAEPQHWEVIDNDIDYTILFDKKSVKKKSKNGLKNYSL